MSMIDPMTGLRTPINLTGVGQGQMAAFGNLFNAAGTPTFTPPAPPVQSVFNPAGAIRSSMASMPADTQVGAQLARAVGNPLATNPGASGIARFLAPGAGLGKLAMRGGVGATAGILGSTLIDKFDIGGQNSNWEQGAQGAAIGAGIGAGVGSVVPVLGTGVGAAVGGVLGGAAGVLGNVFDIGGGDKAKQEREAAIALIDQSLTNKGRNALYDLGGLDADTRAQLDRSVQLQMALLRKNKPTMSDEEYVTARATLAAQIEQSVLQYAANPPPASPPTPAQMGPQDIAGVQMAIGQFMQPYIDATEQGGELAGDALRQLGAGAQADIAESGASRLANAYAAQAQMIPMMAQLQSAQSQWAQFAQQQQAQQMAGGGGAGAGGGFEQLLAQLGAAEG